MYKRQAYNRRTTVEKAVKAFEATGIHPFNPNVFSEEDFGPSTVTEKNLPTEKPMSEDDDIGSDEDIRPLPSREFLLKDK